MPELPARSAAHRRALDDLDGWVEPFRSPVLDGSACALCGEDDGAMVPIGPGPAGELFAHEECMDG